ncbi:MAG: glycosyltransferase family 39 protein [Deltaproteobacteria bacterium]|nr:MAG: glycosyltransferase family 39 protein [Deltaproteobacteria bacterium]
MRNRALWVAGAVLCAGAALRIGLAIGISEVPPVGDQLYYLHAAASLARGDGIDYRKPHWAGTQWPPGQPAFLSLFARPDAQPGPGWAPDVYARQFDLRAARIATALLSVIALGLLVELGRRCFDLHTGLVAGALVSVYPNAVAMSHIFNVESNFLLLLVLAMLAAVWANDPDTAAPRPLRYALAGVAFGAAALVRSIALPLALPFALRALLGRGSWRLRALACAALVAGLLAALAPWTVRNALRYDRFLLLDTSVGESMYLGNNDFPPMSTDHRLFRRASGGRPRCRLPNPADNFNCEVRAGLAHIAAHPGLFASRVVKRFVALANPSSLLVSHAHRGHYGSGASRRRVIVALAAGSFTLLAAAAILGIAGSRITPDRLALLASIAVALAIPATMQAEVRYRLPALPAASLFAAWALLHARLALSRLRHPARALVAALGCAWLAAGWIGYGWTLW